MKKTTLLNPTTSGRRGMSRQDFFIISAKKPEKSLVLGKKKMAGRSGGKISVRHQGGGQKRLYRLVDFAQKNKKISAVVKSIEYDPNRTARIAQLIFENGSKKYVIAPTNIKIGQKISFDPKNKKIGNRMPLSEIPESSHIYNIEINPGKGGQIVRAAGTHAILMAKEGKYAIVQLPSKEIRKFLLTCEANIGRISNPSNRDLQIGKAGRKRRMGIRPTVRGTAMHPGAHPHGGGEGRSGIGFPGPKTPWGKPALGVKTRKPKQSDKMIIKRRPPKKKKGKR